MVKATNLTAAHEVLLAAADLAAHGKDEFSEWDLTIATWQRNKNRFGCRGYEDVYPDHKRVMMEIMAGEKKKDNPLRRGWMEKTKPNHYCVTALGRAEAERLLQIRGGVTDSERSPQPIYDAVIHYVEHPVYRNYCKNPEEPKTWLGAAAFFGLTRNDKAHLNDRLRAVGNTVETAQNWMEETGQVQIRRGVTGGGITIRKEDLDRLVQLIEILKDRFKIQLDAIRNTTQPKHHSK